MFRSSKTFIPTYILIAANIAVYSFTSVLSGDMFTTSLYVIYQWGQYTPFVLEGEVWRLFTAMFIHANIVHIFGNMFFLLIFGLRAEDLFDVREYFLIYLLSGLAGGLLSLPLAPNDFSVGASGAIFGVFGACTIYFRRAIGQSIIGALMYSFVLLMMNVGPGVNVLAHLGGLVAGLLMGYGLAVSHKPKPTHGYKYTYSYST